MDYLYHATKLSNLLTIGADGLDPEQSTAPSFRERSVYFAGDELHALAYVDKSIDEPLLMRVRVDELLKYHLLSDDVDLQGLLDEEEDGRSYGEVDFGESLEICGQCRYTADISPIYIECKTVNGKWVSLSQFIDAQPPIPRNS